MSTKSYNDNPKITDTVVFELECPNASGCFSANPYKVVSVSIYFSERGYLTPKYGESTTSQENEVMQQGYLAAIETACSSPTPENIASVESLKEQVSLSAVSFPEYFKERTPIKVIGSEFEPAWFPEDRTDPLPIDAESPLTLTDVGKFMFEWSPQGSVREGDYFICWTWAPVAAGDLLSAHLPFYLSSDPLSLIAIPSHTITDNKYNILLDRYLPEMYKSDITVGDLTPDTIFKLNEAVSEGFTLLENFANQLIDLFDANALHESLLPYLSNLFNLKLKSGDPTLWRRQIKEAIPLYKQKGTKAGMERALQQAGMRLNKLTPLWQVVSKYVWQESFKVTDTLTFRLYQSHIVQPIDPTVFGLWLRRAGETTYQELPSTCMNFSEEYDIVTMTWVGHEQSSPIYLESGDIIRVLYQFRDYPDEVENQIDVVIRSFPLADLRDETTQDYPPKNWNARVVEDDDPLFNLVIPIRHPFQELLVFGQVRTEFPYSENIYNMEEYNGSTRDSYDACNIDKTFIDPCGACVSSKYNIDVSLQELSNDRISELRSILREFAPFHSVIHSIQLQGEVIDFVQSPEETMDRLVNLSTFHFVLSGNQNIYFHRDMRLYGNLQVNRDELAERRQVVPDPETADSVPVGTACNTEICFICPDFNFLDLGLDPTSHRLQVLPPSINEGSYLLRDVTANIAVLEMERTPVVEPLSTAAFTFNLANLILTKSWVTITQTNLNKFSDPEVDLTQWSIDQGWKIRIGLNTHTIKEVLPNGVLVLESNENITIGQSSDIEYDLLNESDVLQTSGTNGSLLSEGRATINFNDPAIIQGITRRGDFIEYESGSQYEIVAFDGDNPIIGNYGDGDANGVTVTVFRRIIQDGIGYFNYRGQQLITNVNYEGLLEIQNGAHALNADDITDDCKFKENFLINIDGTNYRIEQISDQTITISGDYQEWTTLNAGGTEVHFTIWHYDSRGPNGNGVNVGWTAFQNLRRDNGDTVIRETELGDTIEIVAMSQPADDGMPKEEVTQSEGVQLKIEYKNGNSQEVDI